jgi:hypothetical protein
MFAKLQKATVNFVMPVCLSAHPHGTILLPLGICTENLIFEYFAKICQENSSFVTM